MTALLRVAWRSVGAKIARVSEERGAEADPLAGLRCIGIDEISHRKGQRYLTVVVDHDSGRLIWARCSRTRHSSRSRSRGFPAGVAGSQRQCVVLGRSVAFQGDGAECRRLVEVEHAEGALLGGSGVGAAGDGGACAGVDLPQLGSHVLHLTPEPCS